MSWRDTLLGLRARLRAAQTRDKLNHSLYALYVEAHGAVLIP
jgi:hypothetical protein